MKKSKRPEVLSGTTKDFKLPCGNGAKLYITINQDPKYREILIDMKSSQCYKIYLEAIARLINISLRNGISVSNLREELMDLNCGYGKESCPHVIAEMMKTFSEEEENAKV